MDAAVTQTSNIKQSNTSVENEVGGGEIGLESAIFDVDKVMLELGIWLASLKSFLNVQHHAFAEESRSKPAARDWTRECRLTRSSLAICSGLTFQLGKPFEKQNDSPASTTKPSIDAAEIHEFSQVLKDALLLNDALLRSSPLTFGEWSAWKRFLVGRLENHHAFDALVEAAEVGNGDFLPDVFHNPLENKSLPLALKTDLKMVLPRFANILKALSVVERMMKNDEPLKPSLLIFSGIYERINELIKYVDNRLLRFPNEEDKLFEALDGTAYTASIELRKVYGYELAGLAELRPTPAVFARIETAYSLLNDSFQQTLVNFAQLIEPQIKAEQLFPNFRVKLRESLALRQNLWEILQAVKKAEQSPEKEEIDRLNRRLKDFLAAPLHFLFYKDMETVERFIEEVLITDSKKDLVPVLHRFGAYLETLFGQVNMRAVLAEHPFDGEREEQ